MKSHSNKNKQEEDFPPLPTNLEEYKVRDDLNNTLLHSIAESAKLNLVPKGIINDESILWRDSDGMTILHVAATSKCLNQIPKKLLTKKALLEVDDDNKNVLHVCAQNNCLKQIPEETLNRDTISTRCHLGYTVAHYATKCGNLSSIPNKLITEELILSRSCQGYNLIELASYHQNTRKTKRGSKQLEIIASKLSKKEIRRAIEEEIRYAPDSNQTLKSIFEKELNRRIVEKHFGKKDSIELF